MFAYVAAQVDVLTEPSAALDPALNLMIALGNVSSVLFYSYNALHDPSAPLANAPVNWVGFYLMTGNDSMSLGPFQGRVACTKIKVGRGVCGTCVLRGESQVVKDVHSFPGHIACDGASQSEIVVPIRALKTDNRIVGVLDIDSTLVGTFDDEDRVALERIVAVLGDRLEFPFRKPLRPIGQGDEVIAIRAAAGSRPSTTITVKDLPADSALPPEAIPQVMRVAGWEFQCTELSRMQSGEEQRKLEGALHVNAVPEVIFPMNSLRVVAPSGAFALEFSAFSVLRDAASFYTTDEYQSHVKDTLVIPSSDAWKSTGFATFDAHVDWAWRHRYFGFEQHLTGDLPQAITLSEDPSVSLDWALLRRQDIPIRHFGSLILFEDDLHDHGHVQCTVKFRVMDECFFILLRHQVYIHGAAISVRDVRFFFDFRKGTSIAVEEQVRRKELQATAGVLKGERHSVTASDVDKEVPTMPIVSTRCFSLWHH